MSWFKKKVEKTHFVRDEAGNVIKVERSGDSRTPVSDKLLSQVKQEKKLKKLEWKQQQKVAYDKAFKKARIERIKKQGRSAGSITFSDRLNNFSQPSNYQIHNNYNPFGNMFDTGMKYKSKPSKSNSSKKYTIIGGKAYPIAGTKSKKKKKKSSSSKGYDMFDNWGYMK